MHRSVLSVPPRGLASVLTLALVLTLTLTLAPVLVGPLTAQAPQRSQFDQLHKQHLAFHKGSPVAMLPGDVDRDEGARKLAILACRRPRPGGVGA